MDETQVLIVDDDKDMAEFYSAVFSLLGFNCEKLHTAEDAFVFLDRNKPELILLDLRLGTATAGEEVLYRVRGDARFEGTSVIIVTAHPTLARPISELADLVLIKPVEIKQLKDLSSRVLGVEIRRRDHFYRDALTKLFNEDFFTTRLELAFERYRRRNDFFYAVLMVDIRVFALDPEIQPAGMLKNIYLQVADRLRKLFRPTDTLAFLKNGRFGSLHEELTKPEDVTVLIERVQTTLAEPVAVGEHQFRLEARIGSSINQRSFTHPKDILTAAGKGLPLRKTAPLRPIS